MTSDSVQLTNMGLAQARPKSLTEPPRLKQSKVDSLLDYQDSSESSGSSLHIRFLKFLIPVT